MSKRIEHPAFQSMTVAFLENLLNVVDQTDEFPAYAAQQMLELSGARTAVIVQCMHSGQESDHRVLAAIPQRRANLTNQPAFERMVELLHEKRDIQVWTLDDEHVAPLLQELGVGLSLAVPLIASGERAGGLLLFDLPELGQVASLLHVFAALSQIVALALRSALLIEAQEMLIRSHSYELEAQRRSLKAFFDNRLVGMVQKDANEGYLEINQRWEEMTGYSREELLDMKSFELFHPEDVPLREALVARLVSGIDHTFRCTTRYLRKDGSTFWGDVSATGLYDEQGDFTGMISMIIDVTDRHEAEMRRQELEEQLRQKYKMEAMGVMAGGMAHNFNNNLAIIIGNVELALRRVSNEEEVRRLLGQVKTAVFRSRDMIQQILVYSRKSPNETEKIQIAQVIEETVALLRSTIPTTVDLLYWVSPAIEEAVIAADSTQLQEVLINLSTNAIHAMNEKGELCISLDRARLQDSDIQTQANGQSGEYARLSVQDTGCGIEEEILEKIFDPFFTTKDVGKGTGLGLSSVQGIVEKHNGHIRVHSESGKGTNFELYFPIERRASSRMAQHTDSSSRPGNEKILFVDDDIMLAEMGEEMLKELGYEVTMLTNSREALERIRNDPGGFDLLVTDQSMPRLSGKELALQVRAIRPDLPIVLCTGYSSQISELEARAIGIAAFCMKPLGMSELSAALRRALDKPQQ